MRNLEINPNRSNSNPSYIKIPISHYQTFISVKLTICLFNFKPIFVQFFIKINICLLSIIKAKSSFLHLKNLLYLCLKFLNFGVLFFSNTKLLIFGNFYFIIRKSLNSFAKKAVLLQTNLIIITYEENTFYLCYPRLYGELQHH